MDFGFLEAQLARNTVFDLSGMRVIRGHCGERPPRARYTLTNSDRCDCWGIDIALTSKRT